MSICSQVPAERGLSLCQCSLCCHCCVALYQLTEAGASGRRGVSAAPAVVMESPYVIAPVHNRHLLSERSSVTAAPSTLRRVGQHVLTTSVWILQLLITPACYTLTFIDICLFIDIAAYRCLLTDILYRQGQCVFIVSLS